MSGGITLDAGALIALDRGDRHVLVLLARADAVSARVTMSAPALAQAIRNPARQARLARLIRHPRTDIVRFGTSAAIAVGRLLAAAGSSDVVDAHVVLCARAAGQAVVTSEPDDLHRLDPDVRLVAV